MPRPPLSVPLRRSFGGRRVETSSRSSPTRAPARELSPTSPTRPTQRAMPSRCTRPSSRPGPSRRRLRASRTACQRRRCRFSTGSAPPSGSGRGNLTRPHAGGRRAAGLSSSIRWEPLPQPPIPPPRLRRVPGGARALRPGISSIRRPRGPETTRGARHVRTDPWRAAVAPTPPLSGSRTCLRACGPRNRSPTTSGAGATSSTARGLSGRRRNGSESEARAVRSRKLVAGQRRLVEARALATVEREGIRPIGSPIQALRELRYQGCPFEQTRAELGP
jgi:hypothetical protein